MTYFEGLVKRRTTVINMLYKPSINLRKELCLSYSISILIAKTVKPHTIGENIIKPVIAEILKEFNIEKKQLLRPISSAMI